MVSSGIKFSVKGQTRKATKEIQKHGYEVDLVGARADKLVLASVKSFFGSQRVRAKDVTGDGANAGNVDSQPKLSHTCSFRHRSERTKSTAGRGSCRTFTNRDPMSRSPSSQVAEFSIGRSQPGGAPARLAPNRQGVESARIGLQR